MAITAVLLAGGQSRRMGRDKATLEWRGRPLWECQLEKLRALAPAKILISARGNTPWVPADAQLIMDTPPSRGPVSGLCAAFACLDTEHLLALAVDMPFITVDQLRRTCESIANGCGVIPLVQGRPEPIATVYAKETGNEFAAALEGPDFSLQQVVTKLIGQGQLHPMQVSESDWRLYKSVNEPRDLDVEL